MIKKIGILTWHSYSNFGSSLQAFALQHTLTRLGKKVSIINYHNPKYGKTSRYKEIIRSFIVFFDRITFFRLNRYLRDILPSLNVISFQFRKFNLTTVTQTPEGVTTASSKMDCIVYGSDQIWAPNVYNPIYMGAYVPDNVRKISYAASIGLNYIPDEMVEIYKNNLSSFYAVAVREQEGKELLESRCSIEAEVVLDPTLMVDAEVYRKMQRPVEGVCGQFVFCYFLNKEHQYKSVVEKYAKEHNLQIIGVSDKPDDATWMTRLTYVGSDQFLWLINHSETIFTDSYHGSIFSLLFHKNLWTFVRFAEDSPICQNSRIRQLQTKFNLSYRVISANSEIDDSKTIDYAFFESQLSHLRESSFSYLKKALE